VFKSRLDDDLFFALHAAAEGFTLDPRSYPKVLKLGYVLPRPVGQRRTWLTETGRALYLAEKDRRDQINLPPLLGAGQDAEDEEGENDDGKAPRGYKGKGRGKQVRRSKVVEDLGISPEPRGQEAEEIAERARRGYGDACGR
jgi:hypothetical protein